MIDDLILQIVQRNVSGVAHLDCGQDLGQMVHVKVDADNTLDRAVDKHRAGYCDHDVVAVAADVGLGGNGVLGVHNQAVPGAGGVVHLGLFIDRPVILQDLTGFQVGYPNKVNIFLVVLLD